MARSIDTRGQSGKIKVLSHAKPSHLAVACLVALLGTSSSAGFAQSGSSSPIPGSVSQTYSLPASTAPLPGSIEGSRIPARPPSAPVMANPFQQRESFYKQLPLTAEEARIKIEELSNRLAVSRPQDIKDNIFNICDWLQECADAHWKMYQAFDKLPGTKVQAKQEKETGLKFSRLKNRARLLKADLYIKENRYPEALGPLVEIVVAEPTSDLGQAAYKRLTDMGFSDQISSLELAQKDVVKTPLAAPPAKAPAAPASAATTAPATIAPAATAPAATAPTTTAPAKSTAIKVASEPAQVKPVVARAIAKAPAKAAPRAKSSKGKKPKRKR